MTTLEVRLPGRRLLLAGLMGLAVTAVLAVGTLAIMASQPKQTPLVPIQRIDWQPATQVARTRLDFGPLLATAGGRVYMIGLSHWTDTQDEVCTVLSSADGATWEQASEPGAFEKYGFGFVPLGFSNDGNGGLVVVGNAPVENAGPRVAMAWHSSDGRTWTRAQVGAADGSGMVDVAARPGAVVAFGAESRPVVVTAGAPTSTESPGLLEAWLSADGDTWAQTILPDSSGYTPRAVVSWRGGFAAVAKSSGDQTTSAVWTSTDGRTWEKAPTSLVGFDGTAIVAFGDRVVAVGLDEESMGPASWSSTDGRTWVKSTAPTRESAMALGGVVAVDDGLVAIGESRRAYVDQIPPTPPTSVWVSSDGLTWQLLPADPALTIDTGTMFAVHGRLLIATSSVNGVDVFLGDLVRR